MDERIGRHGGGEAIPELDLVLGLIDGLDRSVAFAVACAVPDAATQWSVAMDESRIVARRLGRCEDIRTIEEWMLGRVVDAMDRALADPAAVLREGPAFTMAASALLGAAIAAVLGPWAPASARDALLEPVLGVARGMLRAEGRPSAGVAVPGAVPDGGDHAATTLLADVGTALPVMAAG